MFENHHKKSHFTFSANEVNSLLILPRKFKYLLFVKDEKISILRRKNKMRLFGDFLTV